MISRRKGILFTLAVVLLFSFALVDCSKKSPAEPTMGDPMTQTEQPKMEEPKVETFEPKVEEPMMAEEPKEMMEEKAEMVETFDPDDLKVIYFDYDKSDLSSASRDKLAINAKLLKAAAMVKIVVEGHCDERGTNEYNLGLGERRANSVKNYLTSLGISASRIKTISYGEEKPFAMGHSETAWKQNRRAHFSLQ